MRPARLGQLAIALALLASTSEALQPGLPSKTAVLIAAARAVGSKDPNPEFRNPDYLAIKFLGPRERAMLSPELDMSALDLDFDAAMARLGMRVGSSTQMWRTKAFDQAMLEAVLDRLLCSEPASTAGAIASSPPFVECASWKWIVLPPKSTRNSA